MTVPTPFRSILLLLVLTALTLPAGGQETGQPSWVLYGLGMKAYEERAFDRAILHFREAIRRRGIFPEAEWMLGRSLAFGGDSTLVRRQLEKALSQADLLQISETRYEILYQLAELAATTPGPDRERIRAQEMNYLLEILKDDPAYARAVKDNLLGGYNRAFLEPGPRPWGLDKVLLLYRDRLGFSQAAHRRLAKLYYDSGAYNKSLNHSLMILISLYSEVSFRYRDLDPLFQYRSIQDLQDKISLEFQVYRGYLQYLADQRTWEVLDLVADCLGALARRMEADTPQVLEEYNSYYTYLGLENKAQLLAQLRARGEEIRSIRTDLVRKMLSRGILLEEIF